MTWIALLLCLLPDTSPKDDTVNPRRFDVVRSFECGPAWLLSTGGDFMVQQNPGSLSVIDLKSGEAVHEFNNDPDGLHDGRMTWDGRRFAVSANDGELHVFDSLEGKLLYTINPHRSFACSLDFTPDGKYLLTGGNEDGLLKVFDVGTQELVRTITAPSDAAYTVRGSADGKYILASTSDGSLRSWSIVTGEAVHTFNESLGYVQELWFSRDGRLMTGIPRDESEVFLWNLSTGQEESRISIDGGRWTALSLDPSGRYLAIATREGGLKIRDLVTSEEIMTAEMGARAQWKMTWSARGRELVVASSSGPNVRVYGPK